MAKHTEQYLSFVIAEEDYAVNLLDVKEIVECLALTRVPTLPPFVRGMANLRGTVVPVVDLAVKFGQPQRPITKWSCIVVVELQLDGARSTIGLLADSVNQVFELAADEISPPPAFGTRGRVDYLRGMGRAGDKFVLLLDVNRLLSEEELEASAPEAAAGAA